VGIFSLHCEFDLFSGHLLAIIAGLWFVIGITASISPLVRKKSNRPILTDPVLQHSDPDLTGLCGARHTSGGVANEIGAIQTILIS